MEHDEINGVKIQRLPTYGQPMTVKNSKWRPQLTASGADLRALRDTIKASEKRKKVKAKKEAGE